MEDLLNMMANVGFPMAVTAYLLIRIEGRLQELTGAIAGLRQVVLVLTREVFPGSS